MATVDPPPLPKQMPPVSDLARAGETAVRPTAVLAGDEAPLGIKEQAALDEIRRRLREGAEVICVVRSRDPQAKSEVIILDKVSPALLGQLSAMARTRDPLLSTSLEIPRKREASGGRPGAGYSKAGPGATAAPRRPPARNWAGSTGGWRSSSVSRLK